MADKDFPDFGDDMDFEALGNALIEMGERLTGESDKSLKLEGASFSHEMVCGEFVDKKFELLYHVPKSDELHDPLEYRE